MLRCAQPLTGAAGKVSTTDTSYIHTVDSHYSDSTHNTLLLLYIETPFTVKSPGIHCNESRLYIYNVLCRIRSGNPVVVGFYMYIANYCLEWRLGASTL